MARKDNILQELSELQSSLVNVISQDTYRVPAGYFEGLADQALRRIKALEAENAPGEQDQLPVMLNNISKKMPYAVPAGYFESLPDQLLNRVKALEAESPFEELNRLAPLVAGISKLMPYTVPAGYFEGLAETAAGSARNDTQTPAEELEALSPLLSGLKKEMLYSVPHRYFESLDKTATTEIVKPQAKVISISKQKPFRYAAAAAVIAFIAITGFLLINRNTSGDNPDPEAIVKKVMKNVSTEEIDRFVQTVDENAQVIAKANVKETNEIKEMIKDIPDEEIQKFLEETQTSATEENNDDLFMN